MRRLACGLFVAVLSAASPCVQSAHAYYDDVHFALTYYAARQNGYTALQAYRIASACSSVDWDPETEPVQALGQKFLTFTAYEGKAQDPRWKFHAMRKELKYGALHFGDVLGNGADAVTADAGILEQREVLWQQAITQTKNPGVFLHAFQDEVPHHGYGAAWGHWPMLAECTKEYAKHKLPIGGTTDWVAFRPEDVRTLMEKCAPYLQKFMDKVSPHQLWRPYYEKEYRQLISDLATPPYPAPIDSELKRQLYVQFYAESNDIPNGYWGNLMDPAELSEIASQLKMGTSKVDLQKHKNGPELGHALKAVNRAMEATGLKDMIPGEPFKFNLDADGNLADPDQMDDWVLVGSLEVTIKSASPVRATLQMPTRNEAGESRDTNLPGLEPVTIKPGGTHEWKDLPIGDLILVLEKEGAKPIRREVTLMRQVNKLPPISIDLPPGPDLKLEMVFEDPSSKTLTVRAVNPPEGSDQLRAAIERYKQSVEDKWVLVTMTGGGLTRYRWQKVNYPGVGSQMLSLLDASFDLPPGKHPVTAKATLLGQSLAATGEFEGASGTPEDRLQKRLAAEEEALKEAQQKVENGREECRKNVRRREEDKADVEKSLGDKDLAPDSRASLEKRLAVLKQEIADWNATLALLDPRQGDDPPWIETLKFWMFDAHQRLAFVHSDMGSYDNAKRSLDEAGRWGRNEKSIVTARLAIARKHFDLPTWEAMSKKAGFEPEYLQMAQIVLLHKNDLGAARAYAAKFKALTGQDLEPGLDLPPADAEFAK
jgi:hypothetical protein